MSTQTLHQEHAIATRAALARLPGRWPNRLRFVGHFLEMTLAMGVGMGLGALAGISDVANTESRALLWLVAMTVPMVIWMRVRGHGLDCIWQMCAAMALPTLFLFPALWSGLISGSTLIGAEHSLMTPAMLAAMIVRRRSYGW